MRRTVIAVFLLVSLAPPVCAQRFGTAFHRGPAGFSRSQRSFGPARAVAIPRYQSGIRVRGGIAFGHHPRWIISMSSRPHWGFRPMRPRHRPYYASFVYPYFFSPISSLPYYDSFDDYGTYGGYAPVVTVPVSPEPYVVATPQPYYPYFPNERVGLDTQMRQEQVGIYRPPVTEQAAPALPQEPATTPPPAEQPPTTLVYRDGRQAEVQNYAIVGQTLWIFNEQRAQKVPLASIDITATQRVNAERGIDFVLPPPQ